MSVNKTKSIRRAVCAVIVLLTFLAFGKAVFISLDIDESYAVALGYRLAKGDRLLRDMWEPHQFSAFLAAWLAAPYLHIRGNGDYLVIYLRAAGILVHSALGLALFWQLRRNMGNFWAFCVMALHLNYLPKWIQMPEFELMCYWCLLCILLLLVRYFTGKRKRLLLFFGGVFLTVSMMCYPTMILLYPLYVAGIGVLERRYFGARGAEILRGCLVFTAGALAWGLMFLGVLLDCLSPGELLHDLSYLFMDTSHGMYSMGEKWRMYGAQFWQEGRVYLGFLLGAAASALMFWLLRGFLSKGAGGRKIQLSEAFGTPGRGKGASGGAQATAPGAEAALRGRPESFLATVTLLAALGLQVYALWGFLAGDENQFFCQIRYVSVLIPALVLGARHFDRMAPWLLFGVLPAVMAVPAVLFVTNMGTNVAYSKVFTGVLGSFVIFAEWGKESGRKGIGEACVSVLWRAVAAGVFAGLMVCRLLLVRVTGCLPVTVLAPMERMEAGPEAGIYVLEERAGIWNDNYRQLKGYVKEGDRLLYIGAESLVYVETGAVPATASTQGTAVFNEMYVYYYEEHPDRIPDVIVFDKTFAQDPAYGLSWGMTMESQALFDWIRERYGDVPAVETDHMIILRR